MASTGPRQSVRRHFGEHWNEGSRLLWLALAAREEGPENVTAALGCARGMSTKWLYGDQRPSAKIRGQLDSLYGVPWSSWDSASSEAFVLPAMREEEPSGALPDAPETQPALEPADATSDTVPAAAPASESKAG